MSVVEYIQGANLGDVVATWLDTNGQLRKLGVGWTLVAVVWPRRGTGRSFAAKTIGVVGADADPNVTVVWADSGEVLTLAPGLYNLEVAATNVDGKVAKMSGHIWVKQGAPAA